MEIQPTYQELQARITELEKKIERLETRPPLSHLHPPAPEGTFLYSLLQSLPFSVYAKDIDGRFIFANHYYCKSVDKTLQEILGKSDFDIHPAELAEKYQADDQAVITSLAPLSFEEDWHTIDGAHSHVRVIKSPFFESSVSSSQKPEVIGTLGIFWDITRQHLAEEEKKKLEVQLVQAQKLESLGIFAGGLAHDFNNILFLITGYTDLAIADLQKNTNPSLKLTKIKEASGRATELVKQILAFARQSSHERRPLDISLVIREAIRLLRSALPSTIHLKQNIQPNIKSVVAADPAEIHQILMNLCSNAAQAMAGRNGTLAISLINFEVDPAFSESHPGLQPGPHVQLTVADTGVGMSSATQKRIFEPFFTTKKQGEGTGLGLSVVHGLVAAMGGIVTVASKKETGTTFQVYLPLVAQKEGSNQAENTPIRKGTGQRIMVVDDEKEILEMLIAMLTDLNYQPTTFNNAALALRHFQENPTEFDLIMTDQTMPIMTGIELSRAILSIRPDIPIILCTGFSQHVGPDEAADAGIRGYLHKPILQENLGSTLAALLMPETGANSS
jgi:signal transduction histidine kinase/ActR/RegA family two-component response regulator